MIANGLGSAIAELLSEKKPTRMKMVAVRDSFWESGDGLELLKKYNLTAEAIVKAVKDVLSEWKELFCEWFMMATFEDFQKLGIRVGKRLDVEDFLEARKY